MFTFLAPQFLWTLLALPVVVALHFIRARKKKQDVSALFLWKQAKEQADTRRRFSPSWLLALQVAFVTCVALALAQPTLNFIGQPDRIFIVDTSASMAARDSEGVRLERAVSEIRDLLRGAGQLALIGASTDARVLQPFTSTTADMNAALDTLVAADETANLERAVALARSLSPDGDIHLFTDGSLPRDASLESSNITLHSLSGDALNLGISGFELGLQQLFVSVVSNHPRPQEITLELYQNDTLLAQAPLLIGAKGQANTSFPLQSVDGLFEVRFQVPEWDALALDNTASLSQQTFRVVSNSNDVALARAFSSLPNVDYQVLPNAALNAPGFNLRILEGVSPEEISEGNFLLFAPATETLTYTFVSDWDRSDPLFRFVNLADSSVGISNPLPFTNPEWETLAQNSELTPLILRSRGERLNILAFNFSPSQTELVNRSAFPLLIANSVASFRSEGRLPLGSSLPDNAVRLENEQAITTTQITAPGFYRVNDSLYAASLLSAEESRLPSADITKTSNSTANARSSRSSSFAFWLVVIAFLAIVAEWLLWSRGRKGWKFLFQK
ncbi:MAG: vWA domain-containing protein [Trueperaceae bacterium]